MEDKQELDNLDLNLKWDSIDQKSVYSRAMLLEAAPIPDVGVVVEDCDSEYCIITDENCALATPIKHETIDVYANQIYAADTGSAVRVVSLSASTLIIRQVHTLESFENMWKNRIFFPILADKLVIAEPITDEDTYKKVVKILALRYNPGPDCGELYADYPLRFYDLHIDIQVDTECIDTCSIVTSVVHNRMLDDGREAMSDGIDHLKRELDMSYKCAESLTKVFKEAGILDEDESASILNMADETRTMQLMY